jgi:L-fucose isomerase-like protein
MFAVSRDCFPAALSENRKQEVLKACAKTKIQIVDVPVIVENENDAMRAAEKPATILDIEPCSFGGIGVIAVKEMRRFYRHVLIEHRFPHHTAMIFSHSGKTLFNVFRFPCNRIKRKSN